MKTTFEIRLLLEATDDIDNERKKSLKCEIAHALSCQFEICTYMRYRRFLKY